MKGRIFLLAGVWVVILAAALAQPADPDPPPAAPEPAPTPTPGPTPPEETRPTRVLTPAPDRQLEEAGQPLSPLRPGPEPELETTIQPEERPVEPETVGTEEAIDIYELGRRRWRIIPIFSVRGEYNDNIFGSETDRVSDFIGSTTFGFIFELGDFREHGENYLSLSWAGQPVFYAQNSDQNAFNQFAATTLQYRFNRMVARWDGSFSIIRFQNRDVSNIVTMKSLWNRLAFSYDYSEKTQLNLTFFQSRTATEGFQGNDQYEVSAGMNYQMFPKTTVGFQAVAGVIDSTDTPLEIYQQLRVQISYAPTEKVTIAFNGGVEFLEFEGTNESRISPVFTLGVKYQPFPATFIGLVAYRNVSGRSLEPGQDYYATGLELTVQQQFFQKFVAELSCGYENDTYFEATPERPTERVDNYVYLRPHLRYAFVHWFSAKIFYEFRRTSSNFPGSSFYNNIAGLEFNASF
jgi:Putative beta-barrel porin 2